MNILVFNGSPKKERNDTLHLSRAFLGGMREAAPQEIHAIDVIDRHIEFCRSCFACKYNGGHCVLDDDMREILGHGAVPAFRQLFAAGDRRRLDKRADHKGQTLRNAHEHSRFQRQPKEGKERHTPSRARFWAACARPLRRKSTP